MNNTRVWIYQSPRILRNDEVLYLENAGSEFLKTWNTHGTPIKGELRVEKDHFIILSVDQDAVTASGCSIDKSVKFFQQASEKLNIDLFDRMKVAYEDDGGKIVIANLNDLESLFARGIIHPETIVYNNLVTSGDELATMWRMPLKNSWHASFAGADKVSS